MHRPNGPRPRQGDDYDLFLRRAGNYKNIYRQEKGFVCPRTPAATGGDRAVRSQILRRPRRTRLHHRKQRLHLQLGCPPRPRRHDRPHGRPRRRFAKLDELFPRRSRAVPRAITSPCSPIPPASSANSSWATSQALSIPYIYNHLGAPWKTQKRVRSCLIAGSRIPTKASPATKTAAASPLSSSSP